MPPHRLYRGLDRLDALVPRSDRLTKRSLEALIGFDRSRVLIRRGNRSYEFTERLSTFVKPFRRKARDDKETPTPR